MRVVAPDGSQVGVKSIEEALWLAKNLDLDLVEVSPNADPPVCRLMDYGKYKYEQSVRNREARKKQTRTVVKEVKFRIKIDEHDFRTKIRQARGFLMQGHKIKAIVMFFGREISHTELGAALLDRMIADLADISEIESEPRREGRSMSMTLAPDRPRIKAIKEAEAAAKEAADGEAEAEVTTAAALAGTGEGAGPDATTGAEAAVAENPTGEDPVDEKKEVEEQEPDEAWPGETTAEVAVPEEA